MESGAYGKIFRSFNKMSDQRATNNDYTDAEMMWFLKIRSCLQARLSNAGQPGEGLSRIGEYAIS